MSGWDWAVIVGGLLQLTVLAVAVVALLRIKNGPVAKTLARIRPLLPRLRQLAVSGRRVAVANETQLKALAADAAVLLNDAHKARERAKAIEAPITYAAVLGVLGRYQQAREMYRQASKLLSGPRRTATPPGPPPGANRAAPRRSLADRLGLVPPAARHLGTVRRLLGVAMDVRRELRRRGLV